MKLSCLTQASLLTISLSLVSCEKKRETISEPTSNSQAASFNDQASKTVILWDESTGENPISLNMNQMLRARLKSNPTSGFTWTLREADSPLYRLKADFSKSASDTSKLVGVGGTQTFEFTPLRAGKANLTFDYGRPLESATPAQTISLTLKIQD